MWLEAVTGRLAYCVHLFGGHRLVWRHPAIDLMLCPGDVVCLTCDTVLWCRAYDPWRTSAIEVPKDHWASASVRPSRSTLFENLQQVLRLAAECPPGPVGDDIRRAACELTEADSSHQRQALRQRMLKAIARIQLRQGRGGNRESDPSSALLKDLARVLCRKLRT